MSRSFFVQKPVRIPLPPWLILKASKFAFDWRLCLWMFSKGRRSIAFAARGWVMPRYQRWPGSLKIRSSHSAAEITLAVSHMKKQPITHPDLSVVNADLPSPRPKGLSRRSSVQTNAAWHGGTRIRMPLTTKWSDKSPAYLAEKYSQAMAIAPENIAPEPVMASQSWCGYEQGISHYPLPRLDVHL